MTLSRRVFHILLAVLILTAGTAFGLSYAVFLPQFDRLDHEYLHQRLDRVVGALAAEQNRLNASTADWAYWNDTYAFVRGEFPEYVEANLAPESFQALQLNLMLFYDAQDRLVLARAVDLEPGTEVPLSANALERIGSVRYRLSPHDPLSEVQGIVLTEAGALIISARHILRSDCTGPVAGTYITGLWLDDREWERIAVWSGQRFDHWSVYDPLPADVRTMLTDPGVSDQPQVHLAPSRGLLQPPAELWGYLILKDMWEQPTLVLKVIHPRQVYLQGVSSLRVLGGLLVLFEALLGGAILALLQMRYGRRLQRLMEGVAAIRHEGNLDRQLEVTGQDEIGILASTINNLTRDLAVSYFSLQESNRSLQRSLAITQASLERLNVLHQIDQTIASDIRLRDKLHTILNLIRQALAVDGVVLLPQETCSLALPGPVLSEGLSHEVLPLLRQLPTDLLQAAQKRGHAQVFSPEVLATLPGNGSAPPIRLVGLAPLRTYDHDYGLMLVLVIHETPPPLADEEWRAFFEALALQTAIALENAQLLLTTEQLNRELKGAIEATLSGWSRALELRDRETQGHSERVVRLTLALARRLGIQGSDLDDLRYGALLHDIGKIGIPDNILLKPGPLTEAEWQIMRQHPQTAYDLLKDIPFLKRAVEILYAHHERWDGSGYPRGLKGEEIPLGARIFAVVDVWDALTSERPYRPAWSPERARAYLQEQAGVLFDPRIVEAFLELLDEEGEALPLAQAGGSQVQ